MNLDRVIAVRNTKTIYRDGDKCIKVFHENFSKSDVLNEALNQARVEETGLNIPRILEVTMVEGKWAIVSEYIKGKTLDRLMTEAPEKKQEYMDMLIDLHLNIHGVKCTLLTRLKDKMSKKISESDFEATTRYDLYSRLLEMPKHNKLCHGDFCPSNVIVNEEGTPFVIDWSHATQGNASADVARTCLSFWLEGDVEGAKYYVTEYCKRSGTETKYVGKWIPIVTASLSIAGTEKEKEFKSFWNTEVN